MAGIADDRVLCLEEPCAAGSAAGYHTCNETYGGIWLMDAILLWPSRFMLTLW